MLFFFLVERSVLVVKVKFFFVLSRFFGCWVVLPSRLGANVVRGGDIVLGLVVLFLLALSNIAIFLLFLFLFLASFLTLGFDMITSIPFLMCLALDVLPRAINLLDPWLRLLWRRGRIFFG